MGDRLHKKSPPKVASEPVTVVLQKQVNAKLYANDAYNAERKLKKGDDGYRIANHSDLADAVGADKNQIKNMFGGVRAGTKTKPVGKSKYVALIREKLGIPAVVTIEITHQSKTDSHIGVISEDQLRKINKMITDMISESAANTQ